MMSSQMTCHSLWQVLILNSMMDANYVFLLSHDYCLIFGIHSPFNTQHENNYM